MAVMENLEFRLVAEGVHEVKFVLKHGKKGVALDLPLDQGQVEV